MEKIGYFEIFNKELEKELKAGNIKFADREFVERHQGLLQPVCVASIQTKDNKVLIVHKATNSTSANSSEKNKTLLYVGGHVAEQDVQKDISSTFIATMKREVLEELNYEIKDTDIKDVMCLYVPNFNKKSQHFAFIYSVVIDKELDVSFTDGKCKFVNKNELNKIDNFEVWSKAILEKFIFPKKLTLDELKF